MFQCVETKTTTAKLGNQFLKLVYYYVIKDNVSMIVYIF